MKIKEVSVSHITTSTGAVTQVVIKASNGVFRHSACGRGHSYVEAFNYALAELNKRVAPDEQVWPDNVDRDAVESIMKYD